MSRSILSALCIGLFGLGATPSTAPTTAPVKDVTAAYRTAIAQIEQGKLPEAQSLLMQADRSISRTPKIIDSRQADIVYASAICSMLQTDYQRAHLAFDRLQTMKAMEREFILNNAKVDLAIKNRNVLAVKSLDTYLASTKAPDEEAIDLFGGAIDKSISTGVNASALSADMDHYVKYNSALEHTRPGMHHWGQQWMSDLEFAAIDTQKQNAEQSIGAAQADVASAQNHLNYVQNQYDNARQEAMNRSAERGYNKYYDRSRTVDPNIHANDPNPYSARLQNANDAVQQARTRLSAAQGRLPHPTWTVNLKPILPGDWSGVPVPEESPASAVLTLDQLMKSMISEVGPAKDAPWTKLNLDLAQAWPQKNALGKEISVLADYVTGKLGPDGAIEVTCAPERSNIAGLNLNSMKITAQLQASETPKAAKLIAGQSINVSGRIARMTLANQMPNSADLDAELVITNAVLVDK